VNAWDKTPGYQIARKEAMVRDEWIRATALIDLSLADLTVLLRLGYRRCCLRKEHCRTIMRLRYSE